MIGGLDDPRRDIQRLNADDHERDSTGVIDTSQRCEINVSVFWEEGTSSDFGSSAVRLSDHINTYVPLPS